MFTGSNSNNILDEIDDVHLFVCFDLVTIFCCFVFVVTISFLLLMLDVVVIICFCFIFVVMTCLLFFYC